MRVTEHRINANGLTHYVRDSGDEMATPAILLHGFPDSHQLWTPVTPLLAEAGYRVIAPDLRGFGETDRAARKSDYEINRGSIPDILAIAESLGVTRAHIVGHDFGAPAAWGLAAQRPDIFITLTAISVGHARAFLKSGPKQAVRSWYILFHQMRGACEAVYRFNNWMFLRRHWSNHGEIETVIANLSRPGRLTAGLDWYRANISIGRMVRQPPFGAVGEEIVRIPTLGLWSDGDKYLTEAQMIHSSEFVDSDWRYERIEGAGHWIPYDSPDRLATLLLDHWRDHS